MSHILSFRLARPLTERHGLLYKDFSKTKGMTPFAPYYSGYGLANEPDSASISLHPQAVRAFCECIRCTPARKIGKGVFDRAYDKKHAKEEGR
jgi:hypothetical protein